ncbi:ASCH domain-containing protein [Gracilibacillus salitolerans]|uniref:ASCH domain-containing protein n=1 Tax=Gracilibacillus salitolerans TaxID=2663022 RepID=A0A5Q2TF82_9BACI|nr:ASCH domain-containing protein [Gracilibacillus salitolerans]QGH33335.1 ASCH domain-containing protein [Gracilibacillus salitolerans]
MTNENSMPLPPKTCSIDRLVTIPDDVDKVLEGIKTATRRNGRYADIGEMLELKDKKFRIDNVYKQKLGDLTEEDANREGYESLEAYKEAILSIHPGMPWLPKMEVWVHEFSALE